MQRVRDPFAVQVKPTYDEPSDPMTVAPGFFQKDPSQPPTSITADWANHAQEELCQLVEGLGEPLDDARDDQLVGLFAQGPFLARIRNDAQATYSRQDGYYWRVGRVVSLSVDVMWSRPSMAQEVVGVLPPWLPVPGAVYRGVVHIPPSDFGAENQSGFYTAVLDVTGANPTIQIQHTASPGAAITPIHVGSNETRRATLAITYRTTGEKAV